MNFKLFVVLCFHFIGYIVKGDENFIYISPIATKHLFVGDCLEIAVVNIKVDINEPIFPTMGITVMIDKTLDYHIDPFFPFFVENKPDWDSSATDVNRNSTRSSSTTVTFRIDFTTETLTGISPSSLVHLYPNRSSIGSDYGNAVNRPIQMIRRASTHYDSYISYNLNFVVSINTKDSEGLYKMFLQSNREILEERTHISPLPWHNISMISMIVEVGAFSILMWFVLRNRLNGGTIEPTNKYPELPAFSYTFDLFLVRAFPATKLAFLMILLLSELILPNLEQFLQDPNVLATPIFAKYFLMMGIQIVLLVMLMCEIIVNRHKVQLKFHVVSWLILSYAVVQAVEMNIMVHARGLSNFSLIWLTQYLMIRFDMRLHCVKKGTNGTFQDLMSFYSFPYKHLQVILTIITSFQLILASMIVLDAPFYAFWVQFAVEDLLYVIFCYYVIVCKPIC